MAETELFKGKVDYGSQWIYFKRNADQEAKITEESVKKYEGAVKRKEKAIESSLLRISELRKKSDKASQEELKKEEAKIKQLYKQKRDAELILASEKRRIHQQVSRAAEIFEQNRYKKLSSREKLQYQKDVSAKLKLDLKAMKDKYAAYEAEQKRLQNIQKSLTATSEEKAAAKTKSKEIETKKTSLSVDIGSMESDLSIVETLIDGLFSYVATPAEKAARAAEEYAKAETHRQQTATEAENALKAYKEAIKDGSKATAAQIKAAEDLYDAKLQEAEAADKAAKAALKSADAAKRKAATDETLEEKKKRQSRNVAKAASMASTAIDSALTSIYGQQGKMQARLQGTNISWQSAVDKVSTNLGFSPIASQQKVVEQMGRLVDSGVAYNLELRAFLAETSENIASTFDAFDSNLLRLIRLQQSDSTAARLGMEAKLTELFNSSFQDSGYLAEKVSDAVSDAILDASATMTRDDSLAFEYVVQKWLGSLYSLGMSSEAVTGIAKGINYLATGNVTALSGDSALQTLLSMSASKTKKSYADMLVGGISAAETNDLLKSMIEILSSIAGNTSNRVTSSAYAELFNMSLTDLRTFSSLSDEEISKIYESNVNYGGLIETTESQLTQILSRKNTAQIVDTVIENAMTGAAQNIGSNVVTYGLWKALNLVDSLIDFEIPGITVVGSGTTSAIDVLNIAKLGFAGMGLVTSLVEALTSNSGGSTNLTSWNFSETTSRGSTLPVLAIGSYNNTSYSARLGVGGGSSDISDVSFESAQDTARESAGVTSEELEESKETPQKIFDAIAGDSTPTVLSLLQEIDDRLDPGRVFYTAISGVLSRDTVSQVTNLSAQLATAKATIESTNEQGSNSNEQTKGATAGTVSGGTQGQTSNVGSQALSGNVISPLDGSVVDLSSMITDAVSTALNNVLASNSYSGIPVRVTNGG